MSRETPTLQIPDRLAFYEDRQALHELDTQASSPEEREVLDGFKKELAGTALALEDNHQATLAKLKAEEEQLRSGNDWTNTGDR